MSFRYEIKENVVTKHHLGKKLHWTQAASFAFTKDSTKTTVCSVKQLDSNTVEIVRRHDKKLGMFYRYLGTTRNGMYERVTIDRKA